MRIILREKKPYFDGENDIKRCMGCMLKMFIKFYVYM